ncbi:hypothetical protein CYY_002808 [Polysphondylium violaceum]|uniref:UbiA prenyltransferase family protein n=1 Tax=Polysphondylium violaceum TaxID=133409 RepID=A0A8J4V6I7_9MYCE|nr:hypothetical protein CYY_002808 [Polysphondylium violaceum]
MVNVKKIKLDNSGNKTTTSNTTTTTNVNQSKTINSNSIPSPPKTPRKLGLMEKYVLANRLWTTKMFFGFTVIILSVLYREGHSINIPRTICMLMSLCLTCAFSNLVNTLYDYKLGVDKEECPSSDRTMFDFGITPKLMIKFCYFNVLASYFFILPFWIEPMFKDTFWPVLVPMVTYLNLLSFFYSAPPVSIKYRGFGHFGIFGSILFVPSLIYYASTGSFGFESEFVHPLTFSAISFCLFVFHGNTHRDIDTDRDAGIMTLSVKLGKTKSYQLFFMFYFVAMIYCFFLAFMKSNIFFTLAFFTTIKSVWNIYKESRVQQEFYVDIKNKSPIIAALGMVSLSIAVLLN